MDSCACVIVEHDSYPECHWTESRVARKEHRCCECGKQIKPGEKYEHVAGKWDGDFMSYKTCDVCCEVRDILFCDMWVYTSLYEDLAEHINNCGDALPWTAIAELSEAARDVVLGMIEDVWKEEDERL
jgi:hypothetical protein